MSVARDRGMKAARYLRSTTGHPAVGYRIDDRVVEVPGVIDLSVYTGLSKRWPWDWASEGRSFIIASGSGPAGGGVHSRVGPPVERYVAVTPVSEYGRLLQAYVELHVLPRERGKE